MMRLTGLLLTVSAALAVTSCDTVLPVPEQRVAMGRVTVTVPDGWDVERQTLQFSGGGRDGYLSSVRFDQVCPKRDDIECPRPDDVPSGATVLAFGVGSPRMNIFEIIRRDSWDETVDGMPASEQFQDPAPGAGQQLQNWSIAIPGDVHTLQTVTALVTGPDEDAQLLAVRAIVASIRFNDRPAPLPAGAEGERVLRDALPGLLDELDQETRADHDSSYYACFPKAPGEEQGFINGGPTGRFPTPVPASCQLEAGPGDPFPYWRVVLRARYDAAGELPSGEFAEAIYLDRDGNRVGWENLSPQ
jgi:hypothetical protein